MISLRKVCGAVLGAWALLATVGGMAAESNSGPKTPKVYTTRDYWEQKVLRQARPQQPAIAQTAVSRPVPQQWSPIRSTPNWAPVETVSEAVQTEPEAPEGSESDLLLDDTETLPGLEQLDPPLADSAYSELGTCETCDGGCEIGDLGCEAGCRGCEHCYSDCWYGPRHPWKSWWCENKWWVKSFSLFAGVHGFKGPADQGRNGNFGFHEGVNWGAPLGGPCNLGYQLGMQAVHSNFSGDQADDSFIRRADRDQIFFTAGIFRRAVCGKLQGGVAFDLLHDSYHGTADLKQIRTESALVFSGGCREIGFWGAFGVGDDGFNFTVDAEETFLPIGPNDTYSLFYRRHFSGGGQGRIWTGLSGEGDALIGADCTVPLGTSWALQNNFTYLLPDEGRGEGGQQEETWSVSIQLVWYPGRKSQCLLSNPFHPLFSVADNSQFLLRTR